MFADTETLDVNRVESEFLPGDADGRVVESFALVQTTSGPEPLAFRRLVLAPGQQDSVVGLDNEVDTRLGRVVANVSSGLDASCTSTTEGSNESVRARRFATVKMRRGIVLYAIARAGGVAWYPSAFGWP